MTDPDSAAKRGVASIADVVASDLCIGCGLCQAATAGRVQMRLNGNGSLRPEASGQLGQAFTSTEEAAIISACPGAGVEARPDPAFGAGAEEGTEGEKLDPVWGRYRSMSMAWAGDADVRFRAATGGVLTGLAQQLLASGHVRFVFHVGPDPTDPLANRWVMSETPEEVLANAGSRYNPTAPLSGLVEALDRGQPFAIVAKPCDLSAVHRYGAVDPRINELCLYRLALVCGGQSRLSKTKALIESFDLELDQVTAISYRGNGNPGPTRISTADGAAYQVSYQQMWEDEGSWDVETRCKLCPDALGECADISAADAWPGGGPVGEDEGFNAVVVRTVAGEALMAEAVDQGSLVLGDHLTPRNLNDFQPHQVRKKVALASRYLGLADAGITPIGAEGLRLDELGEQLSPDESAAQRAGTAARMDRLVNPDS